MSNEDRAAAGAEDGITPLVAFATSLLHIMMSDGDLEPSEAGQLFLVVGGKRRGSAIKLAGLARETCIQAQQLYRALPLDAFLAKIAPQLTTAQKYCILLNLLDVIMADGLITEEEQTGMTKFQQAFGVSDEELAPAFQVIAAKNDRAVFA